MSYDPKSLFSREEHGDPFELIDSSLGWLMRESGKLGYETQATAIFRAEGTTRYARSQVTQHTDLNTITFNLKHAKGKQVASVSSSMVSQEGLQLLLDETSKSVSNTPAVEFFQGFPDAREGSTKDLSGMNWNIEDRADCIIEAVNAAEEVADDVIVAGTATETRIYTRITSSNGIDVEDSSQKNYFKVNAITGEPEQRGYGQEALFWRHEKPDYTGLARIAAQTALDTEKVATLQPGEYEVLLGKQAVSDLVVYLLFSLDGISFHESRSFASDRMGEQIFDSKFSMENLPRDPINVINTANYDSEGLPTQNQSIIDDGVLKFLGYNSFYASKYLGDKNQSTASSLFTTWGPGFNPMSAKIKNGNKSLDDQLSEMEDGLYVKNFWYNRFTLRREGGLTGLTRNGLYHVKDGEIQGAVRNLRYTESFVNAFGPDNINSISKDSRMFFMATCPSMHLKKFNFSSIAHSKE